MLKYRLISFPILFGIFFVVVFSPQYGPMLFAFLAPLLLAAVVYELLKMLPGIGIDGFHKTAALLTALLVLPFVCGRFFGGRAPYEAFTGAMLYIVLTLPLLGAFSLLLVRDRKATLRKLLVSAGAIYAAFMTYWPLLSLYDGEGHGFYPKGYSPLTGFFFLVVVTKMMDTGGYIAGKLSNSLQKNGNHKIVPSLSPGKSYEGTAGGIVFSLSAAFCFWYFKASPFDLAGTLLAGAILALGSFAGDLTESAVKRACEVKDSNSIIPGMGGVFDVLDSFIYNGWIFYCLLRFLK